MTLKEIADKLNTRIVFGRFYFTETLSYQTEVSLLNVIVGNQRARGHGKDMRSAAEDLARLIRGQKLIMSNGVTRQSIECPIEVNGRKYK